MGMSGPDQHDAGDAPRARMRKAPNAFRTISEVADDLHIPQHVLRFWETKFAQVKPLKRGGGRRYYRPDDIALLRRISDLLYIQGYTIKGVQRLLRESGGQLADDIPPASAEERAADDELMLPFAEPTPRATLPLPGLSAPNLGIAPRLHESMPRPPRRPETATEAELERLRRVLAQTLIELETLREMLDA
jgi:DNA-binding transcriptional MerR regulator